MFWKNDLIEKYGDEIHWLVLRYDINKGCVTTYNVLEHPCIVNLCREAGKHIRLATFERRLCFAVNAEFSYRAQWEMGVSDKFPSVTSEEIDRLVAARDKDPDHKCYDVQVRRGDSLDVAYQLWMNWKPFLHYVYRHRTDIVLAAERRYERFVQRIEEHHRAQAKLPSDK